MMQASGYGYGDALAFVEQPPPRTIPSTSEERRQGCSTLVYAFFMVPFIVMGTISFFAGLLFAPGIQGIPFMVLGALFAFPTSIYLFRSTRKIWQRKSVLRDGLVVPGKIISISSSKPAFLPEKSGYDVEIQYKENQDSKSCILRVRGEQLKAARRVMEDGETTPLLIDPSDRKNILLAIQMINEIRVRF